MWKKFSTKPKRGLEFVSLLWIFFKFRVTFMFFPCRIYGKRTKKADIWKSTERDCFEKRTFCRCFYKENFNVRCSNGKSKVTVLNQWFQQDAYVILRTFKEVLLSLLLVSIILGAIELRIWLFWIFFNRQVNCYFTTTYSTW